MGDPLTTAIIITVALAIFTERGKNAYRHTRDKAVAEFARAHPDWSPRKVQRHAARHARGYWWDQIRNGFPDYKRAHTEARELAKAERVEAEAGWLKRRAELRKRVEKALEDKDRLRREELERQHARLEDLKNAPCAYCAAAAGEDCKPGCPYQGTGRAIPDRATEPAKPNTTKPAGSTEPSQQDTTEPAEPSHTDGTVPPATEPTKPEPSHAGNPDRAIPDRATEPPGAAPEATTVPSGNRATPAEPDVDRVEKERLRLARDEEELDSLEKIHPPKRTSLCDERISQLQQSILFRRSMLGLNPDGSPKNATVEEQDAERGNVTPINRNKPTAARQAGNENTSGGNVTTPNVTGEIQGYEAVLAEMDQTIAHLEAVHADADQKVAAFESLDAVYENRINGLRHGNSDEETIETQAKAREANETQISAAKAQLEAASVHLEAELAARARWIEGQGAMKDTGDAVGARGDQMLRD